jgi:exodeoxyribonuclease V alpha subunit
VVEVNYDGLIVPYELTELDEIVPAYAVSVHKSQGSEFPAVVIPVLTQHYILLQRNLIYTAITRGKRLVVLVGTRKALAMAVARNDQHKRHTGLCRRLAG